MLKKQFLHADCMAFEFISQVYSEL